jgi:hypothetical protein
MPIAMEKIPEATQEMRLFHKFTFLFCFFATEKTMP